jgi:hypothetical protein
LFWIVTRNVVAALVSTPASKATRTIRRRFMTTPQYQWEFYLHDSGELARGQIN